MNHQSQRTYIAPWCAVLNLGTAPTPSQQIAMSRTKSAVELRRQFGRRLWHPGLYNEKDRQKLHRRAHRYSPKRAVGPSAACNLTGGSRPDESAFTYTGAPTPHRIGLSCGRSIFFLPAMSTLRFEPRAQGSHRSVHTTATCRQLPHL